MAKSKATRDPVTAARASATAVLFRVELRGIRKIPQMDVCGQVGFEATGDVTIAATNPQGGPLAKTVVPGNAVWGSLNSGRGAAGFSPNSSVRAYLEGMIAELANGPHGITAARLTTAAMVAIRDAFVPQIKQVL